jgi:hypothetical protein
LALSNIVLLLAVIWTIFSAVEYLRDGWSVITGPAIESR